MRGSATPKMLGALQRKIVALIVPEFEVACPRGEAARGRLDARRRPPSGGGLPSGPRGESRAGRRAGGDGLGGTAEFAAEAGHRSVRLRSDLQGLPTPVPAFGERTGRRPGRLCVATDARLDDMETAVKPGTQSEHGGRRPAPCAASAAIGLLATVTLAASAAPRACTDGLRSVRHRRRLRQPVGMERRNTRGVRERGQRVDRASVRRGLPRGETALGRFDIRRRGRGRRRIPGGSGRGSGADGRFAGDDVGGPAGLVTEARGRRARLRSRTSRRADGGVAGRRASQRQAESELRDVFERRGERCAALPGGRPVLQDHVHHGRATA